jgi:hypothetical protein
MSNYNLAKSLADLVLADQIAARGEESLHDARVEWRLLHSLLHNQYAPDKQTFLAKKMVLSWPDGTPPLINDVLERLAYPEEAKRSDEHREQMIKENPIH